MRAGTLPSPAATTPTIDHHRYPGEIAHRGNDFSRPNNDPHTRDRRSGASRRPREPARLGQVLARESRLRPNSFRPALGTYRSDAENAAVPRAWTHRHFLDLR